MHARRLDEAEELLRRAAATFRATDDTYYLGWALRMLGRDLIMQGRLEEAREALDEGLTNFARDDMSAMLLFMSDHAALAGVEGDHERQVRIVGAMQRMQRATGTGPRRLRAQRAARPGGQPGGPGRPGRAGARRGRGHGRRRGDPVHRRSR